jgi:hypothetical protein
MGSFPHIDLIPIQSSGGIYSFSMNDERHIAIKILTVIHINPLQGSEHYFWKSKPLKFNIIQRIAESQAIFQEPQSGMGQPLREQWEPMIVNLGHSLRATLQSRVKITDSGPGLTSTVDVSLWQIRAA